jgi:hypothetical protein
VARLHILGDWHGSGEEKAARRSGRAPDFGAGSRCESSIRPPAAAWVARCSVRYGWAAVQSGALPHLEAGRTVEQILDSFPVLTAADVEAVRHGAA